MANFNLSWSLRPLLKFFSFIGIHLPDEEGNFENGKYSKLFYAGICFLFNLSSQVATLFFILKKIFFFETTGQESLDTVTCALILAIDYTNYSLAPAICHFIALIIVRSRWIALMKSFQYLESQLEDEFYVKLRRITVVGIIFAILMVK